MVSFGRAFSLLFLLVASAHVAIGKQILEGAEPPAAILRGRDGELPAELGGEATFVIPTRKPSTRTPTTRRPTRRPTTRRPSAFSGPSCPGFGGCPGESGGTRRPTRRPTTRRPTGNVQPAAGRGNSSNGSPNSSGNRCGENKELRFGRCVCVSGYHEIFISPSNRRCEKDVPSGLGCDGQSVPTCRERIPEGSAKCCPSPPRGDKYRCVDSVGSRAGLC